MKITENTKYVVQPDHETKEQMRKVVNEISLRYHVEGTDYIYPEDDDWYFISASDYLDLPAPSRTETAEKIAKKWRTNYRRVRIVDTQAEEN